MGPGFRQDDGGGVALARDVAAISVVVPAKAGTHSHRPAVGYGYQPRALSIDHAVWVLAFARTTVEGVALARDAKAISVVVPAKAGTHSHRPVLGEGY